MAVLGLKGRYLVMRVAVGCALGIVTAAAVAPHAGAHAAATRSTIGTDTCSTENQNVDGWDQDNSGGYGNRGYIYIVSSDSINGLHDAIFRNFFVTGDADDYVEGGWTADNGGHSGPVVYSEWKNRGADSGPQFYTGYSLSPNENKIFTVVNVGDISIFRFYVDNDSQPYSYSPTMNFQNGYIQTNSERYNTCDDLFANFYGLSYYNFDTWTSSYNDLECFYTTPGVGWFFDKISNSAHEVSQTSGVECS